MKQLKCHLSGRTFYINLYLKHNRICTYSIDYLEVRIYNLKNHRFDLKRIYKTPCIKQERLLSCILSNLI